MCVLNSHAKSPPQHDHHLPVDRPKNDRENLPANTAAGGLQLPALFVSFAVAAATLVLCGLFGMIQKISTPSEEREILSKSSQQRGSQSGRAITSNIRKIMEKVFAVALPFYVASNLGGARVALIMLLALFSKIMKLEDGGTALTDMKGWKQLFRYRRWTLLSILAQALYDSSNYASPIGKTSCAAGYLALAVSIVALPPPFPSSIRATSNHEDSTPPASGSVVLSSGFVTPSIPEVASLKKSTVSPLVSSPDEIFNTFQAGGVSAILCVLTFFISNINADAFHLSTYGWFFLTFCTASTCLLTAQPKSLQENKGLGILVGAITSSAVTFLFDPGTWRLLASQGVLISLSFLSTQIDTPTILSSLPKTNQQFDSGHHHTTSHSAHSEDHSRLTRFLLETFLHRPLLHSILVEKDSRRIFYFMRYVFSAQSAGTLH